MLRSYWPKLKPLSEVEEDVDAVAPGVLPPVGSEERLVDRRRIKGAETAHGIASSTAVLSGGLERSASAAR